MKIKLIVASMSVLGLITGPAFAASNHNKHKTHQKKAHHHRTARPCRVVAPMAVAPAPVIQQVPCLEVLPRPDCNLILLDAMTQNWNRGHPMPEWFQRIGISGGINFDTHFGNRNEGYTTENYSRFSVNDVYLNTTALINDWTRAFASVSFNNATPDDENFFVLTSRHHQGIYSAAYQNNRLSLEQGYITFGNFNCSPFFVQLGKMFQDHGRYMIHPLTRTLTQSVTETLRTSAKVGFIQNGWHGSLFAFENPSVKTSIDQSTGFIFNTDNHQDTIWGAALGFDQISDCLGFDIGVSYLSNMIGVNDVQYGVNVYQLNTSPTFTSGVYEHNVGTAAAYADINSGPFSLGARFATALSRFNSWDLATHLNDPTSSGAKPKAFDLTAGYGWNCYDRNQNIYLSYQTTRDAVNLFLPRDRWAAGYGIDLLRNASIIFEWDHDRDYGTTVGGTGDTSNIFGVRVAARFG